MTLQNPQPMPEDIQLLTPKELGERLKVSERTIYREQADGRIPGVLVRGKLRFYWPEVLKALPLAPVEQSLRLVGRLGGVDMVAMFKERARTWPSGRRGK